MQGLTDEKGKFDVLHDSIATAIRDRGLQLEFIAFSFGAFFEGAAGFGAPVIVLTMLVGLVVLLQAYVWPLTAMIPS